MQAEQEDAQEDAQEDTQDAQKSAHWKRGICGICPAGCWVEVALADGKLTDIRADTTHPLGMICRRGEKAPEIVYSEHRLQTPMRRVGPKGTLDFEPCTWDEAYRAIVNNLERIKAESGPEAVSIYTGRGSFELSLCDVFQPKGVAVSSASSVLFPFGSPNTMGVGALCYVSMAMIAPHVTMGRVLVDMFADIENAELLIVWGTNPATDSPPLDMHRLEAAAARGAQVIVIDPRRTETVERTGAEWIPIRPGTDGALALSMIEVLIEEELYDEKFAKDWCHGFDDLRTYTQHFAPDVAAGITGVPADTIRRLARAIGNTSGACPVTYTGLEYSDSGVQTIRAVHTLFALAGQLDVPGGVGLAMRGGQFPTNRSMNQPNPDITRAVARDRFPVYSHYRGESHALGLIDAVQKGQPYPIRGLIIHGASILTSWPQTPVWQDTLAALDFLVCIDRQRTADMAYADIVLPATTGFEIHSYNVYGSIFRERERLIEPVGEARNDYLIMAELAARLGYGELYPQTEDALLDAVLTDSGYGIDDVRAAGGTVRVDAPMMEYKKWEKGSLRADRKPGFETPTGKFEIHSSVLEDFGYEPLPKYREPKEGPLAQPDLAADYPLVFNSGARPHTDFRSQHHGIASLNRDNPEPTIELNAADAASRSIASGDLVLVSSPRGSVPFRARVTNDIVAGAVECNMGGGTPVGDKAWREWNVNLLTDVTNTDDISGFPVYKALLCQVEKLQSGDDKSRARAQKRVVGRRATFAAAKRKARPSRLVYLDNSATTPVLPAVREAMAPYLNEAFGNPSSIHEAGRVAREAIADARRKVATLLGTRPKRIIFTGGGSEADNLALTGVMTQHAPGGAPGGAPGNAHLIVSAIEHPAILRTADFLEAMGYAVTRLKVDSNGLVSVEVLRAALRPNTKLVSVMLANNEVGCVEPIAELAQAAHEAGALFHTDAVQAVGKIPVDVEALGVDLLSLSGHKIHAPKGVGALYLGREVQLSSLIHGGKQEGGLRAGTENVPGIVGLGKAAELARRSVQRAGDIAALRDTLESRVRALIPDAQQNGSREHRLPNVLNLTLPGLRGESLVIAMDQRGVALSSGSACKSGSPEPTHVLRAMGRSDPEAHQSVRFSLSAQTTQADLDYTLLALGEVLEELATTVRFLSCK